MENLFHPALQNKLEPCFHRCLTNKAKASKAFSYVQFLIKKVTKIEVTGSNIVTITEIWLLSYTILTALFLRSWSYTEND